MYYIEKGLGRQYRPLAIFFAVAGTICACFGSGTFTQVNAIVEITNAGAQIPVLYTSIALTILVAVITLGGLKSIAVVADKNRSVYGCAVCYYNHGHSVYVP